MKNIIIASTLILAVFLVNCGGPTSESKNVSAILSPDGEKIAFARWFHYYVNKASVFDPDGSRDTKYSATFIYTIDRSTKELTKLVEVGKERYHTGWYYMDDVHISWESDFIAYGLADTIYIIHPDGRNELAVRLHWDGLPILFTLSPDAQRFFYMYKYADRRLYSINLDGTDRYVTRDLRGLREISDIIWDSRQDCLLIIQWSSQIAWQLNPDGTDLRKSEDGLAEYRRRKPFSELEKLTRDITYSEWGVPAPDEFE